MWSLSSFMYRSWERFSVGKEISARNLWDKQLKFFLVSLLSSWWPLINFLTRNSRFLSEYEETADSLDEVNICHPLPHSVLTKINCFHLGYGVIFPKETFLLASNFPWGKHLSLGFWILGFSVGYKGPKNLPLDTMFGQRWKK